MINLATHPNGKRVQLMATCLCDAFFDDVAQATVEVLEHAGCEVVFPENQTCCGQPAFNCGQWPAARTVMRHTAKVFAGEDPVVVPSGSCAAMIGRTFSSWISTATLKSRKTGYVRLVRMLTTNSGST